MKSHISGTEKAESKNESQKVDGYEILRNNLESNLSLSNPSPEPEEEKLQYMELRVKYRDINPVYTKLSQ